MSADQELRTRLAKVIERETSMPFTSKLAADAVMADSALLDDICEQRARQINAERSMGEVASVDHFVGVVGGFARAQMFREAAASVALDRGSDGTYSVGIPYRTPESDPDKPV